MQGVAYRLENWGAFMGRRSASKGRAGSAEGNYIRERTYDLEERRVPRAIVDAKDAAVIEDAWARMAGTESPPALQTQKKVLRLYYVRGCPAHFICHRYAVHELDWLTYLCRAQEAIVRVLNAQREAA